VVRQELELITKNLATLVRRMEIAKANTEATP